MVAFDAWRHGGFYDVGLGTPRHGGTRGPVVHAQVAQAPTTVEKTTSNVVKATHQVTHVLGCVGDYPGNSSPTDQIVVHALSDGGTEHNAHSASWPVTRFIPQAFRARHRRRSSIGWVFHMTSHLSR